MGLMKYLAEKLSFFCCQKMENLQQSTLDDHQSAEIIAGEEEQQSTPDDDQTTISVANEDIISEILSRLPVKSILRFRSVCKPWLSLISDPSFTKLQTTAGRRTALLISAYDTSTRRRYFLSAAPHGGPVTHIVTPYGKTITNKETTEIEHLNGLILFTSGNGFIEHNFAFVINPSTRKMLKLGGPASNPDRLSYGKGYICYFFGFDELRNEYKILTIRMLNVVRLKPFEPRKIEIMIFSMSDLSWRKIDVDLPDEVVEEWNIGTKHGVCVNGVIHLILQNRDEILAFDLRTEKFSVIDLPADAVRARNSYCWKGLNTIISDQPFLTTINGFLGVMCRNPTVDGMDVWTLRDYENRCWVRETVGFEKSWFVLDGPFPLNSFIRKDNNGRRLSMDMINVDVYDVESDSMKSVEFTFGYEFLHPKTVRFDHVRSYTESILPLHMN